LRNKQTAGSAEEEGFRGKAPQANEDAKWTFLILWRSFERDMIQKSDLTVMEAVAVFVRVMAPSTAVPVTVIE
jgi:hypothetical protein